MDLSSAIFAGAAPGLAIIVEMLNPVSKGFLTSNASLAISKSGLLPPVGQTHPTNGVNNPQTFEPALLGVMTAYAMGAVSVASLAPTYVSVLIALFTVIYELPNQIWWAFGLVIAAIIVTLATWRIVASDGLFGIGEAKTEMFSRIIYWVNAALILVIAAVFCWTTALHPPLKNADEGSAGSPPGVSTTTKPAAQPLAPAPTDK